LFQRKSKIWLSKMAKLEWEQKAYRNGFIWRNAVQVRFRSYSFNDGLFQVLRIQLQKEHGYVLEKDTG